MIYNTIQVEIDSNIGIITLNRPERKNIITSELRNELLDVLEAFEANSDVCGIILTGGPDVFAAGSDIKEMAEASPMEMYLRKRTPVVCAKIESMPKPVIAAIGGYCIGGGLEIAMSCDLRIAASNARLGQPEIKIGIIPGAGGNLRLVRLVGRAKAKEIIFTGDPIDPQEAHRIGLVNAVVSPEALMDEARKLAERCVRHSPCALAMAKVAIDVCSEVDINSAQAFEKVAFCFGFSTDDQKEGMRAFLEKRKPDYKGR